MGYLVVIGCFLLLSLFSNNPSLFLVLIPVVVVVVLIKIQAKKTNSKADLERELILKAKAAQRAEQNRLDAIESSRLWDIEAGKQQQSRMQRVNRPRENFRVVSEVCGVCGSELSTKGICISGCKPLEE